MISVPVDPTAPVDRLHGILADAEPALILSDVEGDDSLGLPAPVFHPLTLGAGLTAPAIDRERGDLVSIVYTSGSTGSPKGIMMSAVQMDSLFAELPQYQVPRGCRLGGLTAGTVSYIEQLIGSALVLEGTLVAYEIRRHGLGGLGSWLQSSGVRAFATVPTVLRFLLPTLSADQQFSSVRTVVLSGETSTWEDVTRLRRHLPPEAVIVNGFGLTETSGIARFIVPSDMPAGEGPLPAGAVSPGIDVAIVGADGKPVPAGNKGEIVVRSNALSLGYWRRPDLTAAAFRELGGGRREVSTGDAGRLIADGTLEHLGRLDHLVKISGNRVELGEVEDALTRVDGVSAAAAAPYLDDTQSTRLAACVVPAGAGGVDARTLRAALSRRLPGYMVPDRIALLQALPQLPSGKVDRAAVAETAVLESRDGRPLQSGVSELERSLEGIWCEVLQLDHVGRQDDFFELGGDSMRAARLFVELERRLGIDRPLSMLAEAPTLASLALMLDGEDPGWESLLAISTEGTRPPLFVVHDGAGGVLNARGLPAQLGADQPIYGIRAEGLNGTPPEERSLQELATTYVRRIQRLYPVGPYLFYGASFGGALGLEMARQLLVAGAEVPLVALGDPTPAVRTRRARPPTIRERFGDARRELGLEGLTLLRAMVLGQLKYQWSRLGEENRTIRREERALERVLRRGQPVPPALRGRYALSEYGRLAVGHVPRPPFPEHVLLLRAARSERGSEHRWRELLGDGLQVVEVPGSHNELCSESSADYVGPVLGRAIERLHPAQPPTAPASGS